MLTQHDLDKFNKKWFPEPNTGCWLWTDHLNKHNGYGRFRRRGQPKVTAHKVSYEHFVGPIPDEMQVDHLCRTPACVNPEHLEAVTPRENVMRSEGVAAINARKTQCIRGHPYVLHGYVDSHGWRQCEICQKGWGR